jgi:hypothetical protein
MKFIINSGEGKNKIKLKRTPSSDAANKYS